MPSKLPADAFAFYIALGAERSYQVVADHFDVSKALVSSRADSENWQTRLEGVESRIAARAMAEAEDSLSTSQGKQIEARRRLQEAIADVMTPDRVRALVAAILKAAIKKSDVAAARFLLDRVLGRARAEPLAVDALGPSSSLRSGEDVRSAAQAILGAVSSGAISPEDGQRATSIIETARRALESEEIESRVNALETAREGPR